MPRKKPHLRSLPVQFLIGVLAAILFAQNAHAQAYRFVSGKNRVFNASSRRADYPYIPKCSHIRFAPRYHGANGATVGTTAFQSATGITYAILHRDIVRLEDRNGLLQFFKEEPQDDYTITVTQEHRTVAYSHDPERRDWSTELLRVVDGRPESRESTVPNSVPAIPVP